MARKGSPARLVIALSVAGVLAIFLLYTSIAGGGTPALQPSQLGGHNGLVSLGGLVVGPIRGNGHDTPLQFGIRDPKGTATVRVSYRGSVPDMFKRGRDVAVDGQLQNGAFVAKKDTLVTKCPSKYTPAKSANA